MHIQKTSEKIIIWMHRNKITISEIATNAGVTRQAFSKKIQDNLFTTNDMITLKRMGFNE